MFVSKRKSSTRLILFKVVFTGVCVMRFAANEAASAQGLPQYCCTSAGVLGPYNNTSVPLGGACYGTDSQGQRQNGTACFGPGGSGGGGSNSVAPGAGASYPQYCCTSAGRLGPYNNTSVPIGGACFGTDTQGQRQNGTACQ
jgi:hypothetical protein